MNEKFLNLLHAYLAAAVHLYGTLPLEELWKIYNQQNKPVTLADFVKGARITEQWPGPYILVGDKEFTGGDGPFPVERIDVVDKCLVACIWDDYLVMIASHDGLPVCVYPKEEFLLYADAEYVADTPQNRKLEKWLENRAEDYTGRGLMKEAVHQAQQDASEAECLHELQRMGAFFGDLEDRDAFCALYYDVYDNTPKCIHNGFRERDLKQMDLPPQRKKQRIYAWQCRPSEKDAFSDTREEKLKNVRACGCSRRKARKIRQQEMRSLPPAMLDDCPCGSGLHYEACCGAR